MHTQLLDLLRTSVLACVEWHIYDVSTHARRPHMWAKSRTLSVHMTSLLQSPDWLFAHCERRCLEWADVRQGFLGVKIICKSAQASYASQWSPTFSRKPFHWVRSSCWFPYRYPKNDKALLWFSHLGKYVRSSTSLNIIRQRCINPYFTERKQLRQLSEWWNTWIMT